MVELRKRKAPPPEQEQPAKKKPGPKSKVAKAKAVVQDKTAAAVESVQDVVGTNGAEAEAQKASTEAPAAPTKAAGGVPQVGDIVSLDGFGGEVETYDGRKVTLKQLLDDSKSGVVLFTYPKASTPGCTRIEPKTPFTEKKTDISQGTTQACAFRDGYDTLTSTGLSIYGLSSDGPKANTTFKTKYSFQYSLLSDPKHTLISAIGMTPKPSDKKTKRGVFVLDKSGKVLLAQTGGPLPTVDAVKRLVDGQRGDKAGADKEPSKEDVDKAKTASEVADTAAKLDAPAA